MTGKARKKLDDLDKNIISLRRVDGRKTAMELARQLGVTEGTIRNRMERLANDGIMRIVAVANPYEIGYNTDVLIGLQVDADKILDVAHQLTEMEQIRYVGISTGFYDIIIGALFYSSDELLDFVTTRLGSVPGIRRTETSHILKVMKRTYDWRMREEQ